MLRIRLRCASPKISILAAHGADQAFRIPVLPGRSRRDWAVTNTHGSQPGCKDMSIGSVIIAHQIGRRRCPGEGLSDLSGQPLGCRMSRDLKPQQLSPPVAQDQKREQSLKGQRRDHAHINSGGHLHVVSKKRPPGLRRRPPIPHHVFGDRRLGDFEAEHQQFAMDRGAPQSGSLAHPSDEIAQLTIDLWPPCPISGFPAPKRVVAVPVLGGLHHRYARI